MAFVHLEARTRVVSVGPCQYVIETSQVVLGSQKINEIDCGAGWFVSSKSLYFI